MSAAAVTWDCTEAHQFVERPAYADHPSGLPGLRRLHHPQGPLCRLPLRPVRFLLLALLERCRHFAEDGLCPAPAPLGTTRP